MRALIFALCLLATPALADVTGTATVIDGDTIEVHGQRIRLHGIDAPESRQLCYLDGKPWQCGKEAANALADKIARRPVTCEDLGRDRYNASLADAPWRARTWAPGWCRKAGRWPMLGTGQAAIT